MRHRSGLAAIVPILVVVASAGAAPPRVVSMSPTHGEANVDPAGSVIRVEFDQDMKGSYSFTGSRATMPEIVEPPRWVTPRVCELRVRMQSNTEYRMGLNGPGYTGFQNVAAEPLAPRPLWFRTAPGPEDDVADAVRAAIRSVAAGENVAAVTALREAIERNYSYRDRLGFDWTALIDRHEADLLASETPYRFAARTAQLLAAAEDVHIAVEVGGTIFPGFQRTYEQNWNIPQVARRLRNLRQWSSNVLSGWAGDDIGYLCIATWERGRADEVRQALEALGELASASGLIIDVRPNSGGDETLAREFAGCFIDEPVVYAKHVSLDPASPTGFSGPYERTLVPSEGKVRFRGRVIVLMGPANMSSAEAFLLMMKQVPNCTLMGGRSYGSTGRPRPVELPIGVTVHLPSWRGMRPDGTVFEGEGLAPDVEVPSRRADFGSGDPVFERALEALR